MPGIESILAECRMNLERGRSVATGIGLFGLLFEEESEEPFRALLRRRLERDSLYQQDLSGKWELIGGGMEFAHFEQIPPRAYQDSIQRTLEQEFQEEAGLQLGILPDPLPLFPAFLKRDCTYQGPPEEERTSIDLAFVTPFFWDNVRETDEFHRKLERGELHFFAKEELSQIEIVSPRTHFLIETGFDAYGLVRLARMPI